MRIIDVGRGQVGWGQVGSAYGLILDTDEAIFGESQGLNIPTAFSSFGLIGNLLKLLKSNSVDISAFINAPIYPGLTADILDEYSVSGGFLIDGLLSPSLTFFKERFQIVMSKEMVMRYKALTMVLSSGGEYEEAYGKLLTGEIPFPIDWDKYKDLKVCVVSPAIDKESLKTAMRLYADTQG